MTLRFITMHHHVRFGYKRLNSSEYISGQSTDTRTHGHTDTQTLGHTDCQAVATTQLPQPPSPHQLNVLQLSVDLPAATRTVSYPRNVVSALHPHLPFPRSLDSLSVRKVFHLLVDIPSIPVERSARELLSQSTLQLRPPLARALHSLLRTTPCQWDSFPCERP